MRQALLLAAAIGDVGALVAFGNGMTSKSDKVGIGSTPAIGDAVDFSALCT